MEKPQSSLGIYGVLKESIKTTSRNGKLTLPILLVVFLTYSQIELVRYVVVVPMVQHLSARLPLMGPLQDIFTSMDQKVIDDTRELMYIKILLSSISSVVLLLFSIAVISSSYEAYTAKVLGIKDTLSKVRKTWKKPIVTSFYMLLITLGIISFYLICVSAGIVLFSGVSSIYVFYIIAFISMPVVYFHVAALWITSVVVCVLEEDCGGLKSIVRAGQLTKGKKIQASVIMLLFVIARGIVYLVSYAVTARLRGEWSRVAFSIPFKTAFSCGLTLLMFVAYTIFYHECKISLGGDVAKGGQGLYAPIATEEA